MSKSAKVVNATKELDRMNSVGASAVYSLVKERAETSKAMEDEKIKQAVMDWIFDGDYSEENISPLAEFRNNEATIE